jgi:hypothetical protein
VRLVRWILLAGVTALAVGVAGASALGERESANNAPTPVLVCRDGKWVATTLPRSEVVRRPVPQLCSAEFPRGGVPLGCSVLGDSVRTGNRVSFVRGTSITCQSPDVDVWLSAVGEPRVSDYPGYLRRGGRGPTRFLKLPWSNRNLHCSDHERGLTCTNRSGHGFWLGVAGGYRTF